MNRTKNQNKKVPTLRFPEFFGEWEEKGLKRLGKMLGGGTPSKKVPDYWNGEIAWISSSDISEKDFIPCISRFITNKAVKESATKIVPENSLLIVSRVGVGKFAISNVDLCTSQDFTNFLPDKDNEVWFFAYLLKNKTKQLLSFNQGTSIKGFTKNDLENLKLFIPKKQEQQKIANFLGSVDEWLENLRGQKSSLEEYKKGMMQKIFPADCHSREDGNPVVPELRFKDENGKEFGEWEEKRLGEVGKTFNGLSGKKGDDFGKGKPFITYKQIFDNSEIDIHKFAFVRIGNEERQNKVQFGDLFFTTSSETPLEVGFSSVMLNKNLNPYLNSFSFGFRPNSLKELSPNFSKFFFRSTMFRREIVKLAQGSTRYNISKIGFMKIRILLPSYLEQQKIAEFLTSLDNLIESKQKQISQAEKWKKGLMQGLFV